MSTLYHPLVVHFPVALWLTSALFDILYLRGGQRFHLRAGQYLIGLGLLAAVGSVVTGFVDYGPLVREGIGQAFVDRHRTHSLLAYGAMLIYALAFYLRWRFPQPPRGVLAGLTAAGAALIASVGWLGGELRLVM
ncbi:MAG: hypothetical protein K6W08_13590 [Firmicutes bacterium]|jgi:uncharacterized membrane protein|nr:hypothetical protein [Bacillota bacterium]